MRQVYLYSGVILWLLINATVTYSQSPEGYKDFVLNGDSLILLTKSGTLKRSNVTTAEASEVIDTDEPVVALGIDRRGTIVVGDTRHRIMFYDNKRKRWRPLASYSGKLLSLFFNSQNQCFLVTSKGIVDVANQAVYFPDSSLSKNNQIRYKNGWFWQPIGFLDHQDKLWLGFNHGEWGGDVFAFDTRSRTFATLQTDSLKMTMNPVNGFCEDAQHVYMSGGLSHMFLTHGSIVRFTDGTATPVLQSADRETPLEVTFEDPKTGKTEKRTLITWKGGHDIGPCAYDPVTKCLYFYSQNGIFKGQPDSDLSDIKQWQNVLKPTLRWTGGSPNAAGPAMNVLKMQFSPNGTLLFLTEHDGLGIFDGKSLRFVR